MVGFFPFYALPALYPDLIVRRCETCTHDQQLHGLDGCLTADCDCTDVPVVLR